MPWVPPLLHDEQSELERTAHALGVNLSALQQAWSNATLVVLDDDTWSRLENTDSCGPLTVEEATRLAHNYGRDIAQVLAGLTTGADLPAPVVLFRKTAQPYLVGGNTRLMASRALGHTPKVLAILLPAP